MQPLDLETADYIIATVIRDALVRDPACHSVNVERTIRILFERSLIALGPACYVTLNADRFCSLPAPLYFDAKWHAAADSLQGDVKTCSAHPFPAGP